jgi:hypothetical protein
MRALEICADWKDSLMRRQQRLDLRMEFLGDVPEEEVEDLRRDNERLLRCMKILAWGLK